VASEEGGECAQANSGYERQLPTKQPWRARLPRGEGLKVFFPPLLREETSGGKSDEAREKGGKGERRVLAVVARGLNLL